MRVTLLGTLVDWWNEEIAWAVDRYKFLVNRPGVLEFKTPELRSLSRGIQVGKRVHRIATAVYTAKKNDTCTWKRSTQAPDWASLPEACPLWTKLELVPADDNEPIPQWNPSLGPQGGHVAAFSTRSPALVAAAAKQAEEAVRTAEWLDL